MNIKKIISISILVTFFFSNILYASDYKGYKKVNNALRLSLLFNFDSKRVEKLSAEFPFSCYGPASIDFKETVEKYYGQKINPESNTSYVKAAEEVEKVVRVSDIERGGSFRLEDLPGLIAAVFGETVKKEDIPVIMEYFERHLGMSFNEDIAKFFAILIGTGIGGQRNTTAMLTELVRLYSNREIVLYSAFGAPFEETAKNVLEKLNEAHKDITNSQKRLELLKQRKELVKFLIRAASKSGTTPETMEGFQEQIQEAIRLYSMFVYGIEQGDKFAENFAENMINKLYDGKNFLTGGASVDNLDKDERMMFAVVLDRVILATGKYQKVQQLVDGRARTGGSMFDCFAQAMAEKLEPEFNELGIKGISKVTLYDSFGGRTQGLGPDAFINIAMALVGPKMADPMERLINTARPVAAKHANIEDRGLFGKRLAAFARGIGAEYMYIGLPTTIERRVADSLQQLIGESIDVGGLVGCPTGMKAVVHPTTVLAEKSIYRKDGKGKRLYFLVTDRLADAATKAAEEKIIKEQTRAGNHVVRLEIKDHSPEEVIKLFYELMNFVEWYGNFVAAEVLANLEDHQGVVDFMGKYAQEKGSALTPEAIKNVNFDDTEAAKVITNLYSEGTLDKNDPDYAYYLALRKVLKDLNPWFQPGVEWGKTAAKAIAENLFVKDGNYTEVTDPVSEKKVKIPIRDKEIRERFWETFGEALKEENGAYIVGGEVCQTNKESEYAAEEIKTDNVPGITVNNKYTLDDVKKQIKVISLLKEEQQKLLDRVSDKGDYLIEERRKKHDGLQQQKIEGEMKKLISIASQVTCNEKTAQGIAVAAHDAHEKGLGITFSLYAGRQGFEKVNFEDFAARLSCIDTFNNSPDGQHTDRDGVVAGTKGTLEILAYVNEMHGRKVKADGMIAPYWDGLTPQELIYINYSAYLKVYMDRQIDHFDLRLEGRTEDDIAKIFVLFAQANRIYLELNRQNKTAVLGDSVVSSRNSL